MLTKVKLAYYREKEWNRFLDLIDDRESQYENWEDWHKAFLKTKMELISQGLHVVDFIVDIDKLQNFCNERGIKNNGKTRSEFTAQG